MHTMINSISLMDHKSQRILDMLQMGLLKFQLKKKYLRLKGSDSTAEKITNLPGWNNQISMIEINKEIYDEIINQKEKIFRTARTII